ncbi:MAG TPA: BON domain-containing protein [Phycisphaerae bacterium]|nr:BON domain-containing protein [Phycisphaerae bacterium]
MYWGRHEDEGLARREQDRGPGQSDLGPDWRSEHRGRQWRRDPRNWGREGRGPGEPSHDWLREARQWWSAMGAGERDWQREEQRRERAEREIWQAGPYAGQVHEYRERYWRSPGETPIEYVRPAGRQRWAYGAGGGWYEPRGLRHRERGEELGGAWAGWTREQGPEYRAPKGYKRSDKRIMEDVCDAFMMDERLDPREIEVEVLDGVVILRGSVRHRHEKYLAEDIADSILGVKDVENQVRIAQPGEMPREASRPQGP